MMSLISFCLLLGIVVITLSNLIGSTSSAHGNFKSHETSFLLYCVIEWLVPEATVAPDTTTVLNVIVVYVRMCNQDLAHVNFHRK